MWWINDFTLAKIVRLETSESLSQYQPQTKRAAILRFTWYTPEITLRPEEQYHGRRVGDEEKTEIRVVSG